MTKLIQKNTTIPTKAQQVFSTADDNQNAVTIHVLQGERDVASGNKSLGQFNLEGIPPSPRGMPQIEVTFDIDANGILHVHAKDKATGKENKITIKASTGLSEEEIQAMVKDAEAHADEDKKALELVTARNQAEALAHSIKKSLGEYGDKIDATEKQVIEDALKALEGVVKGDDKKAIDERTQALARPRRSSARRSTPTPRRRTRRAPRRNPRPPVPARRHRGTREGRRQRGGTRSTRKSKDKKSA
jgi:molecular chaperone DnaK